MLKYIVLYGTYIAKYINSTGVLVTFACFPNRRKKIINIVTAHSVYPGL